jgi:Raf kinase inhibitor-like YbhB/YbcL family protein
MEDPDVPGGRFIHWIAWNIVVNSHIKEARTMEAEGLNDFRMRGYRGPCPSYGTHHYIFNVYALDTLLDVQGVISEPTLKAAINGHILGFGRLTGLYQRK